MTTLGQYTLHEELGRGGFATVYRATHGPLAISVALKVLSAALSGDENACKRFTQEAQTASALDHPNIVRILDLDDDQSQVFIAMEYIPGGDLKKRAALPGGLPHKELLRILAQVADALDYAHSRGVLHRDIKPGNILLDLDGSAHLCDFGLVRVAETPHLTQLGSVVGTAAYISPEQAEGKALDGRADQYSLAVVAYELLVGELPFKGETSTAIALLHLTHQPPDPCSLNPQLPAEIGVALLKGLSKEPAQRCATCRDFVRGLETALEDSQRRRYRELLAESRSLLESGRTPEARTALDAARRLLLERPELQDALAELEAASRAAENYEQVLTSWQTAQRKAEDVLELFPDYPDHQDVFGPLGLRKLAPREVVLQVGLGLVLGLPLLGLMLNLAFRWITR